MVVNDFDHPGPGNTRVSCHDQHTQGTYWVSVFKGWRRRGTNVQTMSQHLSLLACKTVPNTATSGTAPCGVQLFLTPRRSFPKHLAQPNTCVQPGLNGHFNIGFNLPLRQELSCLSQALSTEWTVRQGTGKNRWIFSPNYFRVKLPKATMLSLLEPKAANTLLFSSTF